jgi:hypothetical protein
VVKICMAGVCVFFFLILTFKIGDQIQYLVHSMESVMVYSNLIQLMFDENCVISTNKDEW